MPVKAEMETEIAVLKSEFKNLNEKIDGINSRLDQLISSQERSVDRTYKNEKRLDQIEFKMNIIWAVITVIALAVLNRYINLIPVR